MADKKISQLTSLAPALGTDELPINRSNASGKLTVTEILAPEATIRASKDGDLTTLITTAKTDLVSAINEVNGNLASLIPTSFLDADGSLTANSDSKIATQKATKTYVLANATPSATETVQGKAEIATQAETNTGTDDTRFITPLKLKTNLTSKNYLSGTLSGKTLPIYDTVSGTLADSVIKQSTSGSRVLVNGVTDDLATALQVSGSIRQTAVTSKIAAFDTNGILVSGSNANTGYIPRLSTTSLLSNSTIRDDGTTVGIQAAPNATQTVRIVGSAITIDTALSVTNSSLNAATTYGINTSSLTPKTEPNIGIYASAANSTTANTGVVGVATTSSALGVNVGGSFTASSGATNYALQLVDGTQTVAGRFLKNITTDGKANWASITTADITSGFVGSPGTMAKWLTSSTLGPSMINENGTGIGIGNAVLSNSKFYVAANSTIFGINVTNTNATGITFGVRTETSGANTLENIGVGGSAKNSTTLNTGILGSAVVTTIGKNVGGAFTASNGVLNYSVQLKDGTEAVGKILQCMDSNGAANWISHYKVQTILVNQSFTNEGIAIDFSLGNYVILDYSSAIAVATSTNAVTFTNIQQGRTYKIKVKQGTSSAGETYTPTFSGMKWPGATFFTPTVGTGKIDFIDVWVDGVSYYGDFIKNYA